jgi:hypothetical protein
MRRENKSASVLQDH